MGKRIAYFGGSFDPVHAGHIAMAEAALASGRCDEVWFGCAWVQPHKMNRTVTHIIHRQNMTALAIDGRRGMKLCDYESRLQLSPSYTFNVLAALSEKWPDNTFVMLIGADSLMNLHTWFKAEELVEKYSFIVVPRPGIDISTAELSAHWRNQFIVEKLTDSVINALLNEAESTKIRKNFDFSVVLPEIRAYIELCGLYGSPGNAEE